MNQKQFLQIIKKHEWKKFLTRPYGFSFVSIHAHAYHFELKHIVGHDCCTLYVARNGLVEIFRNTESTERIKNNIRLLIHDKRQIVNTIKVMAWHKQTLDQAHFSDKKLCAKYFAHLTALPFNLGNTIIEENLHTLVDYKKILIFLKKIRCLNYFHKFGQHAQPTKDDFVYLIIGNHAWFTFHKLTINKVVSNLPREKPSPTIQGRTAYPGKATGRVRVVKNKDDIKKFSKGDILVSCSTNPELLPAMRIAGAVITDEGGLMSHAAILCRELKIPCIIGTECATSVLKDGELVRVDTKNGCVLTAFV